MADTDFGNRLALAATHVDVGVAVVRSLEAVWRRTKARTDATLWQPDG